ncbi:hypothetical protein DOY81_005598, partial [Sarcophaga bullata]
TLALFLLFFLQEELTSIKNFCTEKTANTSKEEASDEKKL